jgi:hypothetical protein
MGNITEHAPARNLVVASSSPARYIANFKDLHNKLVVGATSSMPRVTDPNVNGGTDPHEAVSNHPVTMHHAATSESMTMSIPPPERAHLPSTMADATPSPALVRGRDHAVLGTSDALHGRGMQCNVIYLCRRCIIVPHPQFPYRSSLGFLFAR